MLYTHLVKQLIDRGEDIDSQDNNGNTCLHQSVINGDIEALKHLTKHGAKQDLKNNQGWTAKDLAIFLGRKAFLPHFLEQDIPWVSFLDRKTLLVKPLTKKEIQKLTGFEYLIQNEFDSHSTLKEAIKRAKYSLENTKNTYAIEKPIVDLIQAHNSTPVLKDFVIQWINDTLGFGLFANRDLMIGEYVGEYIGTVYHHKKAKDHDYLYFYSDTSSDTSELDQILYICAKNTGNHTRFINHSSKPNLVNSTLYYNGLLHQVFFVNQAISKGQQLTYNYGKIFWEGKEKPLNI